MAAKHLLDRLIERLPDVRGRLQENVDLGKLTWFRVGGPAEVLFRPADTDDLQAFLAETPNDVSITVLGVGSNTLIRDGGIPGVSVRLGDGFSEISVDGNAIRTGAGTPNLKLANAARDHSLTGFEFLSGIPGALGGSIRMNAGAFGGETSESVRSVTALTRSGEKITLDHGDLGFSYRHTNSDPNLIFVSAELSGEPGSRDDISARMADIQTERETSQPQKQATGGSTFVNPDGMKAWELIDQAGCRGLKRGDAQVSEKHCNFLINLGDATAADIEGLGEEVRRRVHDHSGVLLEWEIKRIGQHAVSGPREVS